MTRDGFEALAEAYGGDMARWPQDHWDEAALFAAQQPDLAAGVLAAAARLDEALDAWRPLAVSHGLREAVVAAAPAPRARRGLTGWIWRAGAGAGLAAACAAGLVVGVMLSEAVAPVSADETVSASLANYDDLTGLVNGEGA
jgi:hypothetical protein